MKRNIQTLITNAGYEKSNSRFIDILKFAGRMAKAGESDAAILAGVQANFGPPPEKMQYRAKPLPFVMYGEPGVDFERGAVAQMRDAMSLPVATAGAMMPDAHPGYALPIGGVIALENAVSPSFVGYDIACRMTLTILDLSPADFMAERLALAEAMRAVSSFGKGAGFEGREQRDHPVMDDPLWNELPPLKSLKPLAARQLGSSGGGNHFFDALVGEVVKDTGWLSLPKGTQFVALMTHSGSRGTGHKLATHYVGLAERETRAIARGVPKGYEWLSTLSEAGQEYLAVMELMGRYAQANHHLIHDLFLQRTGLSQLGRWENHHNFAWVEGSQVIHRKGATPAGLGQVGIIPGSSGTASYIVEGLGDPASLNSSSHGAGRPFSRSEAKRRHDPAFVADWMRVHDILTFGLAPDEALTAYKDIDRVMALQTDLVKPVARLLPKVVIMGGQSDDGD